MMFFVFKSPCWRELVARAYYDNVSSRYKVRVFCVIKEKKYSFFLYLFPITFRE